MVKECLEPRCCFSNFVWDFFMFAETKHLRTFFKNCPVSKQLCIIIFQVKFIQILSGGYCRTVFYQTYCQKLLIKCPKTKQGISQYSDASENVIFHNIKPKLSELRTLFLLIPNM